MRRPQRMLPVHPTGIYPGAPGGFGLPEEKNEHRFARCLHYGSLRVLEYHRLQTAALAGQEVNGQEAGRGMK